MGNFKDILCDIPEEYQDYLFETFETYHEENEKIIIQLKKLKMELKNMKKKCVEMEIKKAALEDTKELYLKCIIVLVDIILICFVIWYDPSKKGI